MDCKNLNVAVVIGSDLESGGGYQYEYMVLDILKKNHTNRNINFFFYGFRCQIQNDYRDLELKIKIIEENFFQKIHRLCLSNFYLYKIFRKLNLDFCSIEKQFKRDEVDIVYFLSPSLISQGLNDIPYIFTLWDLGHLDLLEFPEISSERQFEAREIVYTKSLKKAYKIIVDLEYGKKNAIKKYNLDDKRVEVLKFLPNIRLIENDLKVCIKEKYNLKNNYVFYPAQFWPHKNHIYILKALKILRDEKNIAIDVVFSGLNKGNLEYILKKAKEFKIDDLVNYIGFAPNDEIPYLYNQSLALVMPTYLGPTNIPPLEAFAYNTTVCYSDLPFFREQVEDAAFFIDLSTPYSLVDQLILIQNNKDLVEEKKLKGLNLLKSWDEKDFYHKLLNIFKEYQYIRELWK